MVTVFSPTSRRDARLDAVKQECEDGRNELGMIKDEQEDTDAEDIVPGDTSPHTTHVGLTDSRIYLRC
jgi:hypothetical protein